MIEKVQQNRKILLFIYLALTIAWTMVIFSFSLQNGEESSQVSEGFITRVLGALLPPNFAYMEQLEFLVRKLAHFMEYLVLGVLMTMTFKQTNLSKREMIGWVICVMIASCDETIQLFSGGRSGKIADVILDSVGALVGVGIVVIIYKWLKSK